MTYHYAEGAIRHKGKHHKSRKQGVTQENAKKNVVRSLANKLRYQERGTTIDWVKWKSIPKYWQDLWLDAVVECLVWIDTTSTYTRLAELSATEFSEAWRKGAEA